MSKALQRFARIQSKVFNRAHIIHPGNAEMLVAGMADRLGIAQIGAAARQFLAYDDGEDDVDEIFDVPTDEQEDFETRGYDVAFGVAKIDIEGTLVMKNYALRPECGMTGYDGIRENFINAMNDERVKAIALFIDSPGGEVQGCFDLADLIYRARGRKPVWAILQESAFSAAYAIASACDRITVPRTGGTGSIGVVWMHCDFSAALEAAGIKVTFVTRGTHKVEGAPEIPLSDEALATIQKEIDTIGELFEATVARNRNLSTSSVRDMNAATFLGVQGVTLGLADEVLAPDAAFRALVKTLA